MAPTPPRASLHLIGCLIILLSVSTIGFSKQNSDDSRPNLCDQKVEENSDLPCPETLDVFEQYSRPENVYRLDFNVS